MTSPADQIIRLGFGFAISQALHVVIDLSIADHLAGGELGIADLARQTGSEAGALYRIMRLLAAEGVFRETSAQRFVLEIVPFAVVLAAMLGAALQRSARAAPGGLSLVNS